MEGLLKMLAVFGSGAIVGALIVLLTWFRDSLRERKHEQAAVRRSEDRQSELLAIMQVINKDQIKALAPEIEKTQRLIRARPSDL